MSAVALVVSIVHRSLANALEYCYSMQGARAGTTHIAQELGRNAESQAPAHIDQICRLPKPRWQWIMQTKWPRPSRCLLPLIHLAEESGGLGTLHIRPVAAQSLSGVSQDMTVYVDESREKDVGGPWALNQQFI